jgi:methylamine dehydrogenase accessory protein MauD
MSITLADITLPTWLVVSQWTLLFALGFLIIVMYRQVGYLQQLKNVGSEREGLPIGEKAPTFDHTPVNGSTNTPARFEPQGRWSLLVFADPTCASCQGTLLALGRVVPKIEPTVRVLVATTAEPAQIATVDAFQTEAVAISRIRSDVSTRLYRTQITPFGYLIDPEGKIRAREVVADEATIRKMLRKADRGTVNVEATIS